MSDDGARIDRDGIHIDADLAEDVAIEEELDSNVVGVYLFPSPERRRLAGWALIAAGGFSLLAIPGGWPVAVGLTALAVWPFLSSWPLHVDEKEAMMRAAAEVSFPIGHASAAVRFQGWRSRPRWATVLYSAADPPDQRALVVVDAVDGSIVETPYVEEIAAV